MLPLDEGAMGRARTRLSRAAEERALGRPEELAVWLAGVTGANRPIVAAHTVVARSPLPHRDLTAEPALTVGEVAQAVDEGRERAAAAAADGASVLVGSTGTAPLAAALLPSLCLGAVLTARPTSALVEDRTMRALCQRALARHPDAARGPLHALRRLGSGDIALLCGVALGAGERGLAYLCDDLPSAAAAAVAVAIEPALRPRVSVAQPASVPVHRALLDHLALTPLADHGGVPEALALMRRAAAMLES
jgi:nicotinate-nucleotide--dimethylbenzimidazole phosphoribosyltransferase